jgi:hypothetical protein
MLGMRTLLIAVTGILAGCAPSAAAPSGSVEVQSSAVANQTVPAGVSVDLTPRLAPRAVGGEASLLTALPDAHVLPTWTTELLDAPGGSKIDPGGATQMRGGIAIAVLGDPIASRGSSWYRAFALSNQTSGPADYFGWIPADPDGTGGLALGPRAACPLGDTGIADLSVLDPFTRARCLGAASYDLEGYAGWFPLPVWYDVQPAWMGKPQQNSATVADISLHADASIYAYYADSPSVDLQLPPGLPLPPYGFKIAVRFHVADQTSGSCRRSQEPSGLDVPEERAADSELWCTTRLVLEQWRPLLGPEGRPIDPSAPQLHRHPATPGGAACAGVGMSALTFHVDPSALDPVWLRAAGYAGHIIASFEPSFRAIYTPELVVVDAAGRTVARDGTPLDPDGGLLGHPVCPMGDVVSISQ